MTKVRTILLGAIAFLVVVGVCSAILGGGAGDDAAPATAPDATPTPDAKAAEEAEDKRKGLHCLSDWDGDHEGLERLVQQELNDPDSMKTLSTLITPVQPDSGQHVILMEFTAKNVFGGVERYQAVGLVEPGTCQATLVGIE